MKDLESIAKWVIDNRYAKSENEKVSDSELYHYLVDAIGRLLTANNKKVKSEPWISVKDRMPEERKNVLATINYDELVHIAYVKDGMWHAWIDDEISVMGDAWLENKIDHEQLGVIAWQELPQRAKWVSTENNLF